jgi:CDP-glucose 4,6-dehydratase
MAVLITSDKCYRNLEWTWGYRENDTLGGDDPYSASKACAELITQSYSKSFFSSDRPRLATARAGNVIGGGDWASYRLVPDCVRAWSEGQSAKIRFPRATRPWQHVLEPLSGYLCLGAKLWSGDPFIAGEAFNFGPPSTADHTVEEVISLMGQHWPQAKWEIDQQVNLQQRESTLLKLCCDKALNFLQWRTLLPFPQTIGWVTEWYRTYYEQGAAGMHALTCRQIAAYQSQAQAEKLPWAT